MKEKYYYLRRASKPNKEGEIGIHRCGIVYLITAKDILGKIVIARGVSLCNNEEDPFLRDAGFLKEKDKYGNKQYVPFEGGLRKAKRRAFKAFNSKSTSSPIQTSKAARKVSGIPIAFKSTYMPTLSDFEAKLLDGGYSGS